MVYPSYWQKIKLSSFEPQSENINCDVLIVGAGLCGLLCAYELLERGVNDIVIIDANTIASGTTAYSTAKLTAQHGLIYGRLIRQQGIEKASQYATANQKAIERAIEIGKTLNFNNIHRHPAFVYAKNAEQMRAIESEAKAARALGFDADITVDTELPIKIEGALRFDRQAAIHPLEFAAAILNNICERGCKIYEHTKAIYPEKNVVVTDKGKIFAEKVVISTRFPFADKRGLYFAKLYQQRSYILMLKSAQKMNGYYVGADNTGLSFRPYEDKLLICGTENEDGKQYTGFFDLISRVVDIYPDCEVISKWSAEDCITHDAVPYIGKYKSLGGEAYVATGFNKWGISSSLVAGQLISELIVKGHSPYEEVFSPSRSILPNGAKSFFVHTAEIAGEFISDFVTVPSKKASELSKGESAVVADGSKKVCACRDENGLHELQHRCTHMGCPLKWNSAENTWDCPCHGSRFSSNGEVINGPAGKNLPHIRNKRNKKR